MIFKNIKSSYSRFYIFDLQDHYASQILANLFTIQPPTSSKSIPKMGSFFTPKWGPKMTPKPPPKHPPGGGGPRTPKMGSRTPQDPQSPMFSSCGNVPRPPLGGVPPPPGGPKMTPKIGSFLTPKWPPKMGSILDPFFAKIGGQNIFYIGEEPFF